MRRHTSDRGTGGWRSLVSIAAVAYLLASLVPLLWIVWQSGGWVTGDATVFRTTVDGQVYEAIGLTYRGTSGSILLWGELLCVPVALFLSCGKHTWARGAGHALLLVWAGVLCANAWRLVIASDLQMLRGAIAVVTLGTLAVIVRAFAGRPRSEGSGLAVSSSLAEGAGS